MLVLIFYLVVFRDFLCARFDSLPRRRQKTDPKLLPLELALSALHRKCEFYFDDIISDMTDLEVVWDQKGEIAEDLEEMAGQSPVIQFVNYLISNAIREGALNK